MQAWVALALGSLLLWGVWGFLAKIASDYLTARSAAAMQGLGVAAGTLVLLAFLRFRPDVHVGGGVAAFLAGAALFLGIITFVWALGSGGKASVVVPMTAVYPVVTILLSVIILREQMAPVHVLGMGFALVAVVLLSR